MPMITGGDKAQALREVLDQGSDETYPIRKVHPTHGDLIWILDRAAAAGISTK
jgi:6-phosphogluconolactonase/glucosamine-6-phosphate isomerase/deaminase